MKDISKFNGITEYQLYDLYTIELTTDCHGDYNKIIIRLLEERLIDIIDRFRPLGEIESYLSGLYKLDKDGYYKILFSTLENTIFITLRKHAKPSIISVIEELIKKQEI
jgi:hypothetical protein